MRQVFVLFGNAGFGKDTVADAMVKQRPGMRKIGFADPIKITAMSMLGIPREIAFGSTHIKDTTIVYGKTVRHWLRWVGEIARKNVDSLVYVHRWCDDVLSQPGDVVAFDARHWNELEAPIGYLKAREPDIMVRNILVYRPDYPVDLSHTSESETDDMRKQALLEGKNLFNSHFLNMGTKADLERTAVNYLRSV